MKIFIAHMEISSNWRAGADGRMKERNQRTNVILFQTWTLILLRLFAWDGLWLRYNIIECKKNESFPVVAFRFWMALSQIGRMLMLHAIVV